MVRLRHAIWRRVLGTLIGSFNDGSIGAVAGILVWGTHMNAAKGQIRSHGPDHPSSFARMSTTNCMFAISVPIWSESDCFGPAGWTSCSKSLIG